MTKRDLATVLTRLVGLYFAYLAAKQVVVAAYGAWYLFFLLGETSSELALHQKLSLGFILPGLIEFTITAGLSYYLLKNGNWLIEFLGKDAKVEQSR